MNRVHIWLLRHLQTLIGALGQMVRAPLATALTLAVLGITLALPAGLAVALDNLVRLGGGWQRGAQISLFLKREVSEAGALKLAQQIRAMSGVITVEHISRAAALEEFRRQSGFGAALDALRDNPRGMICLIIGIAHSAMQSPKMLKKIFLVLCCRSCDILVCNRR